MISIPEVIAVVFTRCPHCPLKRSANSSNCPLAVPCVHLCTCDWTRAGGTLIGSGGSLSGTAV
jgi:hypothetical protein